MNKKLLFALYSAASLAMLNSCSSDSVSFVEEPPVVNEPSEVQIQLVGNTSSLTTRAAVMSETTLPGSMGVWCLAKGVQNINQNAQSIRWFSTSPSAATCCLMNNVKSTLVNNVINWSGSYYYPVSQFYNYEFYSNYPYTTNVTRSVNRARASYQIDGRTDIIWGRATSNEAYAWSANYFRQNGGASESNIPNLTMEHMLTRLTFTVEPGASVEGAAVPDYTDAANMKLLSIQLCDVYTNVYLDIADFNNPTMTIDERLGLLNTTTDTLSLCNASGVPFTPMMTPATPSDKVQVGESIMLYPSATYMVRITLEDKNGVRHITETPLVISNASFERGKSYSVAIVVHGPQEIDAKAQIMPWQEMVGPSIWL